ncbi:MAG TPA: AAA family ATPase [Candidatus Limnocylindrales bacterium]
MRLVSATFHNYRTLRSVEVPFRPHTVIVGANNSGKSSILDAIDGAFGLNRRGYGFSEQDVSPGSDLADGLSVRFEIRPDEGEPDFAPELVEIFGMHVDVGDVEGQRLFLRVVARQEDDGVFRTRMYFEKADGLDDGSVSVAERQEIGFLLLRAVREGRREFYERSGLWAKLSAAAPPSEEVAAELARAGEEFATSVLDKVLGSERREAIVGAVGDAMNTVLFAGDAVPEVTFTLVPADPDETLRAVEVRIGVPGDAAPKPVSDHSVGTQSVAVVGLFSAYLDTVPRKPMALGIEEPEAHLHPHATRAMVRRLSTAGLQTIVTTHSTSVTDAADPRSFVVLRRTTPGTVAHAVPPRLLGDVEAADIRRRIAEASTEFLFARLVLLTEGPSERAAFPLFAARLGWDLDILGVSVTAVGGGSFKSFLKLLGSDALDIPHVVVCDNDAAAKTLIGHLRELGRLPNGADPNDLAGSRAAMAREGFFYWADGALERVLLGAGLAPEFVAAIEEVYPGRLTKLARQWTHTGPVEDAAFLERVVNSVSKPIVVRRVAELMSDAGRPVPAEIEAVLAAVHERAIAQARVDAAAAPPAPDVAEAPSAGAS